MKKLSEARVKKPFEKLQKMFGMYGLAAKHLLLNEPFYDKKYKVKRVSSLHPEDILDDNIDNVIQFLQEMKVDLMEKFPDTKSVSIYYESDYDEDGNNSRIYFTVECPETDEEQAQRIEKEEDYKDFVIEHNALVTAKLQNEEKEMYHKLKLKFENENVEH